jgi:putative phosphoserine phosphatase/1-acylglycerol-3-phosphate O-acyltransferase
MPLHDRLTEDIRNGPKGPKVAALFDLDQTLLAGFSVVAFFRERLLSGRMAPQEMSSSVLGALSYGLGRIGFSGLMAASTAAYRGTAENILEEVGEEAFEKHLATQIYPESRALVAAHRDMGHTVAIISSATRYQAEPLARDLGIEHVLTTELEVEDGVFTGRVKHPTCFGEGKAIAARTLAADHDLDLEQSYFYSDSHEDLPLLEAVGKPRPLNPDRALAQIAKERQWLVRRFTSRGTPGVGDLVRTGLAYASIVPAVWAGAAAGLVNTSLWSHRPAVFIFNHQSGLDAILMLKLLRRDLTGVGKKEIKSNPIFGPLFGAAGAVFIDRSDRAGAIRALAPAVTALHEGRSLLIAPEGTRSRTPRLGRFKKGAFHIAMQAGVPIVPVVFRNVLDALPRDALVVRPATVEAVVLPPIDTRDWTREGLDEEIRAIRDQYLDVLAG